MNSNFELLKDSYATDLPVLKKLEILYVYIMDATDVSVEDFLTLLPRRVANYIMQLRKSNKKMWEDFYRTFFSEDEYGQPISKKKKSSVLVKNIHQTYNYLNAKALISSNNPAASYFYLKLEKMHKKNNYDQYDAYATIEHSLFQMKSISRIEQRLTERTKQILFLFAFEQSRQQAFALISNYDYQGLSQMEISDRCTEDFNTKLADVLNTVFNSLTQFDDEIYQLQRYILVTRLILLLNGLKISGEIKYICQSFAKQVFSHFLFCYTKLEFLMIDFLVSYFDLLQKGFLNDIAQILRLMIEAYQFYYHKKVESIMTQNTLQLNNILDYYFIVEKVYVQIVKSQPYSIDEATIIIEHYRRCLYDLFPNKLVIEILNKIILKDARQSYPQDPFEFINAQTEQKRLISEYCKYLSQRYLHIQEFQWQYFLFVHLGKLRDSQKPVRDSQYVEMITYIRNNFQIIQTQESSHLQKFESRIFNLLLQEDETKAEVINNYLMLVISIFDKQIYVRILALFLFNYYKAHESPEVIEEFQSMIHYDDRIVNKIIVSAFQLLDEWFSQQKDKKTKFAVNYAKQHFRKDKIGLALLRLARYTEAVYYLERHVCEQKILFNLEIGKSQLSQEEIIGLLGSIWKAKKLLNVEDDLESSLLNLDFNQTKLKKVISNSTTRDDKLKLFEQLLVEQSSPLEIQFYSFSDLQNQQSYLNITDKCSVDMMLAQLTVDVSKWIVSSDFKIEKSLNFLKISICTSIKQTNSMQEDNKNVLKAYASLKKMEDFIQKGILAFDPNFPDICWYYLSKQYWKKKKQKDKYKQYRTELLNFLYKQRNYKMALKLCKPKQHALQLAKIYCQQGKYFKSMDLIKLPQCSILFKKSTVTFNNAEQCGQFIKYLDYLEKDGYYPEKVIDEFKSLWTNRKQYPISEYFRRGNRLSSFTFKYAGFLEKYKQPCQCSKHHEVDQNCAGILELYLMAVVSGDKFIQESFPKIFRYWFEHDRLTKKMMDYLPQIGSEKLIHALELIITGVEHFKNKVEPSSVLAQALCKLSLSYPDQMIWWLAPLKHFNDKAEHKTKMFRDVINLVAKVSQITAEKIENLERQMQIILKICNQKFKLTSSASWSVENINSQCLADYQKNPEKLLYPNISNLTPPFPIAPIKINHIQAQVKIAPSKDHPKKIQVQCSDGTVRSLLLKTEVTEKDHNNLHGDTRREQRIIQMLQFLNKLLKPTGLQYPLFASMSLNQMNQIIQWVDETQTLKALINQTCQQKNVDGIYPVKEWEELIKIPPKLDSVFFDMFLSAHEWYQAQQNFIKSMALWSAFQYLIGFGDRHSDNILMDRSGTLIHIDYECLFHKGRMLPVPEIVDFRLTKNLRFAMGYLAEQGQFRSLLKEILSNFHHNQEKIIAFLDPYIYDPLLCKQSEGVVQLLNKKLKLKDVDLDQMVDNMLARNKDYTLLRYMYYGWGPHL